jgi:hypothetical protein
MRAQYYFRKSPRGLCAWNVQGLVERTRDFVRECVPLSAIRELDELYWGELTCRKVVGHARLMLECDFEFPVILSSDGRVMDGMHRISKALFEGLSEIEAVRFVTDPEPDYIGVDPDELPY